MLDFIENLKKEKIKFKHLITKSEIIKNHFYYKIEKLKYYSKKEALNEIFKIPINIIIPDQIIKEIFTLMMIYYQEKINELIIFLISRKFTFCWHYLIFKKDWKLDDDIRLNINNNILLNLTINNYEHCSCYCCIENNNCSSLIENVINFTNPKNVKKYIFNLRKQNKSIDIKDAYYILYNNMKYNIKDLKKWKVPLYIPMTSKIDINEYHKNINNLSEYIDSKKIKKLHKIKFKSKVKVLYINSLL